MARRLGPGVKDSGHENQNGALGKWPPGNFFAGTGRRSVNRRIIRGGGPALAEPDHAGFISVKGGVVGRAGFWICGAGPATFARAASKNVAAFLAAGKCVIDVLRPFQGLEAVCVQAEFFAILRSPRRGYGGS